MCNKLRKFLKTKININIDKLDLDSQLQKKRTKLFHIEKSKIYLIQPIATYVLSTHARRNSK